MWHIFKRGFVVVAALILFGIGTGFAVAKIQGSQLLSVQTGSMKPAIKKGDLVQVARVPQADLAVGDVVTYVNPKNKNQTITHRITELPSLANHNKFVVKGDANAAEDAPISGNAIVGKVVHKAHYVGYGLNFMRTPLGVALLVYIPALMIVIDEIRRLSSYYATQRPYIVPEMVERLRLRRKPKRFKTAPAVFVSTLIIAISLLIAWPVQAALSSTAVLSGNTISIAGSQEVGHILIKSATFECSQDNSPTASRLLEIIFYNPTSADINTSGWHVESSSGTVVTMRSGTMFDARDDYDIEPDIPLNSQGWVYSGDFLALFDAQNNLVDGISWGSDTSQLNPSLPAAVDGNDFRRVSTDFDTNTTADWDVNFQACSAAD